MASAPLLVASAQSPPSSSPAASTSTSSHPHPVALARADSRRRTSSGPPAPPSARPQHPAGSPSGLGLPEGGRPIPRGPNTSQQQQPSTRSPVRHSPSSSHGSFFSAFRRSSNSHPSSLAPTPAPSAGSSGGRALSPTSTTAGGGGSPLGGSGGSSSYVVPVIKDEHALHRSRTLAKQLLGPSSSAGRHRSPEGLGVTREDDDDAGAEHGLQHDETHPRRRHVTAEGVARNGGPTDRVVSVGSHGTGSTGSYGGQALSPSHTHGHAAAHHQQLHHAPPRAEHPPWPTASNGHPQGSSSLGIGVPEYASEPATDPSVGGGSRVVRIDGRLFRFDATGDRLDLVPPREETTDSRASPALLPTLRGDCDLG